MTGCSAATTGSPPSARSARGSSRPSCARRRRRGPPRRGAARPARRRSRRARAPRAGRPRHAQARPRGRRRLPQPARPRAARDRRRRAPRRRARRRAAERLEPPGPVRGRGRPSRTSSRPRWLAFLLALVGPDAPDAARSPRRRRDPDESRPRRAARPRGRAPTAQWARARRLAGRRLHRRGRAGRPQRRFARVFERLALPGFGRATRFELLAALGAAGLYALERRAARSSASRTTPRRRPPSACWCPATGCCSSAARATSRRRPSLPLAALDRGLARVGHARRPRRPRRRSSRRPCAPPLGCDEQLAPHGPERFRPDVELAASLSALVERPPAGGPRPARAAPRHGARRVAKLLVLGCLALAALAHVLPAVPTYDPWAWIIWGREIAQADLVTRAPGPSWKPLPVLFTTPFALAGRRRGAASCGSSSPRPAGCSRSRWPTGSRPRLAGRPCRA